MSQSAIMAAVAARDAAAMRAAFVGEFVPTIPNATDPVTYDPRELGVLGGNVFPAVVWQSKLWFRDAADTTTLADEIACIVTLDGSRYKTDDIHMPWSVLSRAVTMPPDPDDVVEADRPEFGEAWLVPAAATGEWATHEDEIAVWTSRGWVYRPPQVGNLVYVQDELGFIHYSADDEWEDGTGLYGLPDGSILPNHLLIRAWQAENRTTTAPPGTGPAGETYIIGASATGTWTGHDRKIAFRKSLNAAFTIIAPFVGEVVYDKAAGIPVRWNGTVWLSAAGSIVDTKTATYATITNLNNVIPYDSSIPQIGEGTQIITTTFTPKSTTNKLRVRFTGPWSHAASGTGVAALFLNSNSNAIAAVAQASIGSASMQWMEIIHEFVPATTSSITLSVRVGPGNADYISFNGVYTNTFLGSTMTTYLIIDEIAA